MKKLVFLLAFIMSSCILNKYTIHNEIVNVYGLPLVSTTKLPKDDTAIQDSSYFLFRINDKSKFMNDILLTLSLEKKTHKYVFGKDNIRILFKVLRENEAIEEILIDRNGNHVLFREQVYEIGKPFSNLIDKYFPDSINENPLYRNRMMYRKKDYIPKCCR